ncbi:hypothetical protein FRB94_007068 [Tulasnella sp. JGI-2019a]|nr:hypothetical protein FRB94_007068 [Tulasnella sp. JGI-2019a]KAG9040123.1 hypothetical protein FRB95_000052 [Tulasnella sp. JGI-2019a]
MISATRPRLLAATRRRVPSLASVALRPANSSSRGFSSTPPTPRLSDRDHAIAFVGLGAMGRQMATNLFSKTFTVDSNASFVVCDALPEAAHAFARSFQEQHPTAKIDVVRTPGEAARRAATVITMLPSSPQVNEVYLSTDGIFPSISRLRDGSETGLQTLAIDSTTLDVVTAKEVAEKVALAGVAMVDAPVSGGVVGATAGTLSFMVGGPKVTFDQAQPFLKKMGKNIVHCGDSGTGLAVKICNNLILGINQTAVAEAMLLGTSLGLSPALMTSVINNSTGRCWPSSVNNPVPGALPGQSPPCERDFKGGFASKLMLKDLNLALNAAKTVSVPLPLGSSSIQIYEEVSQDAELAGRDFSVVFRWLENQQKEKLKKESE